MAVNIKATDENGYEIVSSVAKNVNPKPYLEDMTRVRVGDEDSAYVYVDPCSLFKLERAIAILVQYGPGSSNRFKGSGIPLAVRDLAEIALPWWPARGYVFRTYGYDSTPILATEDVVTREAAIKLARMAADVPTSTPTPLPFDQPHDDEEELLPPTDGEWDYATLAAAAYDPADDCDWDVAVDLLIENVEGTVAYVVMDSDGKWERDVFECEDFDDDES